MASFGNQLCFFLLLVLVISPQIQAREGKFFSLFTHFRTIYNAKDPQVLPKKAKAESPTPEPIVAPSLEPIVAPTLEPITAPTPAPSHAAAIGSTIPSGPAPEPEFFVRGDSYGLYGRGSYSQYSPTKDTPTTTTTFENELFNDESYKTGYPKTNFHTNYNNEEYGNNYNNNGEYRNNYNNNGEYRNNYNSNEEFSSNDNNGYNKIYVDSYSNNNYNGKEYYNKNNYNGKEYYYNNNYNANGYYGKKEGMSDTRFLEKGQYYYNVNTDPENYNLNGYESGRGSTENVEGFYEKSKYPNEFDTMEEYEKQQASQGYMP